MRLGYYGKTLERGDFVRFNLPQSVVNVWDDWLQQTLNLGREKHPDEWSSLYQSAPAVRFSCSSGVMGEEPWFGVLLASSDKVGRQFPFCILGSDPSLSAPMQSLVQANTLLSTLETLTKRIVNGEQSIDNAANVLTHLANNFEETLPKQAASQSIDSDIYAAVSEQNHGVDFRDGAVVLLDAYMQQHYQHYSVLQSASPSTSGDANTHIIGANAIMISAGLPAPNQASSIFTHQFNGSEVNLSPILALPLSTAALVEKPVASETGAAEQATSLSDPAETHSSLDNDDEWSALESIDDSIGAEMELQQAPLPQAIPSESKVDMETSPTQRLDTPLPVVKTSEETNIEAHERSTSADIATDIPTQDSTPDSENTVPQPRRNEALEVETLDIDEEDLSTMPWES